MNHRCPHCGANLLEVGIFVPDDCPIEYVEEGAPEPQTEFDEEFDLESFSDMKCAECKGQISIKDLTE